MHETTHVFQKQTDPNYSELKAAWEGLTQGADAYKYQLDPQQPFTLAGPPRPFRLYGYEQQASIVEDYFLATQGLGADLKAIPPDSLSEILYSFESTIGSSGLGPLPSRGETGSQSLDTFTQPSVGGRPK